MTDSEESKNPPKESMRARVYFDAYCALGTTRALSRLTTILVDGKTTGQRTLEKWSSWYHWVERAHAYDENQLERKKKIRQEKLDKLYDDLERLCEEQTVKTLQDLEKLRNSEKGLGSIATTNLLKLLIDTHIQVLGGNEKQKVELTGKDGGKIEMETTVETFWGRGTDPRRKIDESKEEPKQIDEEAEVNVEFGSDDEEDSDE